MNAQHYYYVRERFNLSLCHKFDTDFPMLSWNDAFVIYDKYNRWDIEAPYNGTTRYVFCNFKSKEHAEEVLAFAISTEVLFI